MRRPKKACVVPLFDVEFEVVFQHHKFHLAISEKKRKLPSLCPGRLPLKLNPADGRHSCPKAENCKQRPKLHPCTLSRTTIICASAIWAGQNSHYYSTLPKGGEGCLFFFPSIEHHSASLSTRRLLRAH